MTQDLLEELSKTIGCTYLSDLKQTVGTNAFFNSLRSVPEATFSLSEWNECAAYLLEEDKTFTSEKEARECLMQAKAKIKP